MTTQTLAQNHRLVKTPGGYLVSERLATVTYDRSARQYVVANGREIGRFPAGKENRTRAEWRALSYNDGQLYQAAQAMLVAGHDEGRLLRAAALILDGRVIDRYQEGSYSRATIQAGDGNRSVVTGQDIYHVTRNIIWSCTCEDYQGRRDAGERTPLCKHALAVMLLERQAGEDEAEWRQAQVRELEHLQERRAGQLQAAADSCPKCSGRGITTGINTWTGWVGPLKCDCQIDF